jgi:hypothetical protein
MATTYASPFKRVPKNFDRNLSLYLSEAGGVSPHRLILVQGQLTIRLLAPAKIF